MKRHTIAYAALMLVALMTSGTASAQTCTANAAMPSAASRSNDWMIAAKFCTTAWVNPTWANFGFITSYWDDGFGWENACDADRLLGRTLAGIFLLQFGANPSASSYADRSGTPVKWAYAYTGTEFMAVDDFRAYCGDGSKLAAWVTGVNNHFDAYVPLGYGSTAPVRAAVLFHEAIHRGVGTVHNCGDDDCCWLHGGAYYWEINYLIDYYWRANGYTNSTFRTWAADEADTLMVYAFCYTGNTPAWARNFR